MPNLVLQQAVLHILDKRNNQLWLSDYEVDLSESTVREYLHKLIGKVYQADIKKGQSQSHDKVTQWATALQEQFIEQTKVLATTLYEYMERSDDSSAADYVFWRARDDNDNEWIGFMRLDYHLQYTHVLDATQGIHNQLIQHQSILPNMSQKPSEAFLFNVRTYEYALLEKRYTFEGKKRYYLSQDVLELQPSATTPQQIKQVKQIIHHVSQQFDEATYDTLATAQQLIYEQLDEGDSLRPQTIMERVFEHNLGAYQMANEQLAQRDIAPEITVTNVPKYEKKYCKQRFKLANGIEIMIPAELYGNRDVVEFVNNPDGTISVIIKDVESIHSAFNG